MAKKSEKIFYPLNLLKSRKKDTVDTIINWSITIGRFMVIAVELVALSAFLYRFSLDRQIIDLNSKIKQQEAAIQLLKDNEIQYRNLHERLASASTLSTTSMQKIKVFQNIVDLLPQNILLNTLSVLENKITINVSSRDTSSLKQFVNSLKTYPQISKLFLNSIGVKDASGLTLTLVANIQ